LGGSPAPYYPDSYATVSDPLPTHHCWGYGTLHDRQHTATVKVERVRHNTFNGDVALVAFVHIYLVAGLG